MVVIGVCVFGWISYQQLPLNLMPDISYPSLTVRTEYAGTAPEEVETTISRPVEQVLGIVNNLVSISSISKAGQSDVILEFSWDTDMNLATADVREKLDQVWLPEEVKRPLILRYDPSLDPIMRVGLYGEHSLFYLRYLAEEDIKRKLETVEGVAAIKVKGGLEEEIRVELNEQQLTLIGINIRQINNRLAQENINLAGGNLREGQTEYLVRTLNEFKSISEIEEIIIGNWNGKEIKIKDIANVKRTNKEREIITRINGEESVEIEIFKEADANIVSVAKNVSDIIFGTPEQQAFVKNMREMEAKAKQDTTKKEKKKQAAPGGPDGRGGPDGDFMKKVMTNYIAYQLPDGMKVDKLSDQSVFIENAVNEVMSTAMIGGILAIIVLFVFLRNFTATLIVGVSIPISIIATFAPMKIFGVSLNIMSLGGLALGIGMLVDNSIVVLESIARCRDEGDNLIDATIRGVGEVGSAVFASTLTTIAVFFPIVFVEGVAGQIFGDMALTVVFSLLASLAVALFLIPMLSSRESQKFIQGINFEGMSGKNIYFFKTNQELDELIASGENETFWKKAFTGLVILIKTLAIFIFKILKIIFAFILSILKSFSILFIMIVAPLIALVRLTKIYKFKISGFMINYSGNSDLWRIKYIKNIWPTYLVNKSFLAYYEDVKKMGNWFRNKRWWKIILLIMVIIFPFLFYTFKFVMQFILELIFKAVHMIFTFISILIRSIVIIIRILLHLPTKWVFQGFNWSYEKIAGYYPVLLKSSLENRNVVTGSFVVVFIITLLIIGPRLGSELIPEVHQGEFNLELTLPVGTPVERTDERVVPIEKYMSGIEDVELVASVIGTDKTETSNTDKGEHTAKLTVGIKEGLNLIKTEKVLIQKARDHVADYSGIQSKISRPVLFSFKTPIEVEIRGYNLKNLLEVSKEVEDKMQDIPGLFDVKANIQRGNPEVQIIYNRNKLARYNLNILDVASIVRNKVRGDVATEFKDEDRKIDVLVRVRDKDKETISDLSRLIINPGAPIPIELQAVADIIVNEGPSEIRRVDQQRTALITANISERDLQSVSNDIYDLLSKTRMPSDFIYEITGQNKEMETSLNSLQLALALAIFLVYIVMASQFESLVHPFIIIFTIPMAMIGVILYMYVFNMPLSIVVFLGMIMLAGIVVNNAIVLVDYINHLRQKGMKKIEAIITAGNVRLRPILMTTSTTVLGLLPMALGFGDGAEIRTPMAITVIIGLLTSTLLTLILIPTVYSMVDRSE